ncbi:IS4 family transposase [Carboxylicivirga mesophila]|uniref:IS4 family transposase n=1 Tax=Carboxylicivirga mesophila TaxID=1166478 RepID=A0ABS5KG46_9BACT|nr:IS4 family transposase [Carboxylicivirga mesophila]MBS2214049.1 IS4 family transposase [Carboxylicivirga mesophila]
MKMNEFNGCFKGYLSDYRIEKRAEQVMNKMFKSGTVVVNKFCSTFKEKKAAYGLFKNVSFTEMELINSLTAKCKANQGSRHLLCIQDTTEINYTNHINRIGTDDQGVGPITRNDNAGFFCHPMLIIDSEQQMPLGFSSVQLWNRSWNKKDKHERKYFNLNIEDKESYRWLKAPEETKAVLSETPILTVIGDRESDIYEELVSVPDEQTHLLIRSSVNRRLYQHDDKLFEHLEALPSAIEYELPVKYNKKRKNRIAKLTLKFTQVKLSRPQNSRLNEYPEYVEMWAIEAHELAETVPENEEPIIWRLLTTHPVEDVQSDLQCIEWYAQRWIIEELFRVIKSKGLQIEASQLTTGVALKKQLVMALQVALTTMSLKMAYDNNHKIKATVQFSEDEIVFMEAVSKTLEGNTQKQKNPFAPETLAYCSWVCARLSGWSGYASQGNPGYISIKQGLDRFKLKYEGYRLAMSILNNNNGKG